MMEIIPYPGMIAGAMFCLCFLLFNTSNVENVGICIGESLDYK